MAHKGKATFDVSFNLEDLPEAYTNLSVHSRISEYTEVARSLHGPYHDPSNQDFDGEAVMRAGQGKKHGRFWLGDGVIDTASTPSLSLRSEHGARARARPFAHGRSLHSTRSTHSRLFLFFTRHALIFTHLN